MILAKGLLSRQLAHEFLLIIQWAFIRDHLKILMKAGKVIEPAFITKLLDAHFIFDK